MSERTSPEQSDGIIASPPRLMGEALYRIWSPDGPKGWPQKSPEEVARFHEALAELEDTSGLSRFDYERAGHFTRAVLGNEPPPTFVIDQQKIDGIMGDSSGRQGVVDWYKRLTGHDWESRGVYLPDMDTAIIYTPKPHNYDRDSVMAHESAHRKGVVLTRMLNEGFASLVQYLYRYPLPTHYNWKLPAGDHGLGLFTVAALCDQHPDLFDKMAAVVREPSGESYADLVERLYEATGITSADFKEILKIDRDEVHTEYPQVLRKMIREEYFQEKKLPVWNLIPKIIEKLKAYQQATGHSMGMEIDNLRAGERVFLKGPTHPQASNKSLEAATPPAESNSTDDIADRILDVARTMGTTAQTGTVEPT